jgi:serine/threonine protein kinase
VHRDLKSLNLLLDNKWNVKVSDFGLTKFRDELKKGGVGQAGQMQGSVHWMAPEILNETLDADYILADVYAFGSLSLNAMLSLPIQFASNVTLHRNQQGSSCGSSLRGSSPTWA